MFISCNFSRSSFLNIFLDLLISFLENFLLIWLYLVENSSSFTLEFFTTLSMTTAFSSILVFTLIKYLIELILIYISFFFNLILQYVDFFEILFLFDMFLILFISLQSFMEFLIFHSMLFLFKIVYLLLLLKKSWFDFSHVFIRFQHFCEKIIWSANRYFCLD